MSAATVAAAALAPPARVARPRTLTPVRSTEPPRRPGDGTGADHGTEDGAGDPPAARSPAAEPGAARAKGDGARPRGPARPRLRTRPVPLREPFPLHRIRTLEGPDTVGPAQGTLSLTGPSAKSAWAAEASALEDRSRQEWVVTFVHAALEVAGGLRSPGQLVRWTGLEVHAMLVRRGALAARLRGGAAPAMRVRPAVRAVLMSSPAAGAWEVAVVVQTEETVRAVALRLEEQDGRRRVTELEIG